MDMARPITFAREGWGAAALPLMKSRLDREPQPRPSALFLVRRRLSRLSRRYRRPCTAGFTLVRGGRKRTSHNPRLRHACRHNAVARPEDPARIEPSTRSAIHHSLGALAVPRIVRRELCSCRALPLRDATEEVDERVVRLPRFRIADSRDFEVPDLSTLRLSGDQHCGLRFRSPQLVSSYEPNFRSAPAAMTKAATTPRKYRIRAVRCLLICFPSRRTVLL